MDIYFLHLQTLTSAIPSDGIISCFTSKSENVCIWQPTTGSPNFQFALVNDYKVLSWVFDIAKLGPTTGVNFSYQKMGPYLANKFEHYKKMGNADEKIGNFNSRF